MIETSDIDFVSQFEASISGPCFLFHTCLWGQALYGSFSGPFLGMYSLPHKEFYFEFSVIMKGDYFVDACYCDRSCFWKYSIAIPARCNKV